MIDHSSCVPIVAGEITPNPLMESVEGGTRAWIEKFDLVDAAGEREALFSAGCGSYAALTMPRARSRELQMCSDYFAWLIAFDDAVGETATDDELISIMNDYSWTVLRRRPRRSHDKFSAAIIDIAQRGYHGEACGKWAAGFMAGVQRYMLGCVQEARWRALGCCPPQAAYDALRLHTIGMDPIYSIIELASDRSIDGRTAGIAAHASHACAWANDYHSLDVRNVHGDPFNLASVYVCDEKMSLRDALAKVVERYDAKVSYLEATIDRSHSLQRAIMECVLGNAAWYASSPRYADRRAERDRSSVITGHDTEA